MSSSHSSSSLALVLFPALQFSPENCVQLFEIAWSTRLLCPWDSPGKNTGVDCHVLLQRIFLTQGSNACLMSLKFPALADGFFTTSITLEAQVYPYSNIKKFFVHQNSNLWDMWYFYFLNLVTLIIF